MQSRILLFLSVLLLFGCDEQVIRLDIADADAGDICRGQVNDAGECIERDWNMDGRDSDRYDQYGRVECEGIEAMLTTCIESLGADHPRCIALQAEFDASC
jgi:hypothetical protein